jgi:LysW-gamma-L-lysine carboxypeptidase
MRPAAVIATWGGGPTEVVLLGHLDTVAGLIPVTWTATRIIGRGAVDAKGPLAAAIAVITSQSERTAARYTLIGAVEEEGRSRHAFHLQAGSRPSPAHLIVLEPSGWDAIALSYKGGMHLDDHVRRPLAHGSAPTPSALGTAIAFVRTLPDHAGMVSMGKPAFERLDVRVLEVSPKAVGGLEDFATMRTELRLPPGVDAVELTHLIRGWAEGATVEFGTAIPAHRAEKNTPLVRAFLSAIRAEGGTPRFKV